MDRDWWKTYVDDVNLTFKGERFSNNSHPSRYNVTKIKSGCYANSGAGAIVTAIEGGATKVILLGYDCQHTNGKTHWHGDHPPHLGNARQVDRWHEKFSQLAIKYAKIEILNASRETALDCFPCVELESVL
jgi:hypothetical protein